MTTVLKAVRWLSIVLLAVGADLSVASATHPLVRNMPANSWLDVPDSRLDEVCACVRGFPQVCAVEYCAGLLSFSGGVFDERRNRFVLWGGGHRAYVGNELYAFSLDTLKWQRLTDPSPPKPSVETLDDGRPNSRHTYDGLAYDARNDLLVSIGGSLADSGGGSNAVWTYGFADGRWQRRQPRIAANHGFAGHAYNYASAFDPVSKAIYLETTNGLYAYDVNGDEITRLIDFQKFRWSCRVSTMLPDRRLFLSIGDGLVAAYRVDTRIMDTWSTTGGESLVKHCPGIKYHPPSRSVFAWNGGPVYRLDVDTKKWSAVGGPPTPKGIDPGFGLYGRWAYAPRDNVFVAITSASRNVLLYKPPAP